MAYTQPTPATFKAKYPEFASVPDLTVQSWLDEAHTETTRWPDDGRARGEMLYTAHNLALAGFADGVQMPEGVTRFKSADFEAGISETVANRTGWRATRYGRDYVALMRRYFGAAAIMAWEPRACVR